MAASLLLSPWPTRPCQALLHMLPRRVRGGCLSSSAASSSARIATRDRQIIVPSDLNNNNNNKRITSSTALAALSKRELEIRRKIQQLKNEGKIQRNKDDLDKEDDAERDAYAAKIRQKLGGTKSKMLGFASGDGRIDDDDDDDNDDDMSERADETAQRQVVGLESSNQPQQQPQQRRGQLGALPISAQETTTMTSGAGYQRRTGGESDDSNSNESLGSEHILKEISDDDEESELDEDALIDLVAQRMQEKWDRESRQQQEGALEQDQQQQQQQQQQHEYLQQPSESTQITSGVGGSWDNQSPIKTDAEQDMYQPKTGSWGAFPRPRDISKAYGGGRRVGPGYSNERKSTSVDETREKLQRYRVKVGIDVESEKEHAGAIDEALKIGSVAMQRGMYATAVSALEKVTPYCSTNSKVGGQVFLELAMAYEAAGRTQEAITVYETLSRSRIEPIKINAKRLMYGIEAMQFMQDNVKSPEFSRKRVKQTFIDTTGLDNIASKFDDVYETAYVDLSRSFYKKLTEHVVRSSREARQILLRATGPGEVDRMKIVQALRSLSRRFADALQDEIDKAKPSPEPTAVMDGKPILKPKKSDESTLSVAMEDFVLMKPDQMLENLSGEWRLQLIADKRGDGVKFFNSTVAWQQVDTNAMSFTSLTPQGFITIQQQGQIKFNRKRRILRRQSVQATGGGGLASLFSGSRTGAVGAINLERQLVTVDSSLLVTRGVPSRRGASNDDEKDYFAVWRRVEPGTFIKEKKLW